MPRFALGAEHAGERLDKVLARLLPEVSRATVQRWMTEGRVLIDGAPVRPKHVARAGEVVEVTPGPEPGTVATPDPSIALNVVFEDDDLLVVDKPAGMVVHPARGNWEKTLVNALLARPGFERLPEVAGDPTSALRPGIVHRIDKDTSGLLVVAKSALARDRLTKALSEHRVERAYLGLTDGVPVDATLTTHYGRHPKSRLRFSSRVPTGKTAITHVTIEERLAGGRAALIRCVLETGRTHQIRVHVAEQCRTPLLADRLYGRTPTDEDLRAVAEVLGRQALHAAVLGFTHPISGEALRFESPLPPDLDRALSSLRRLPGGRNVHDR